MQGYSSRVYDCISNYSWRPDYRLWRTWRMDGKALSRGLRWKLLLKVGDKLMQCSCKACDWIAPRFRSVTYLHIVHSRQPLVSKYVNLVVPEPNIHPKPYLIMSMHCVQDGNLFVPLGLVPSSQDSRSGWHSSSDGGRSGWTLCNFDSQKKSVAAQYLRMKSCNRLQWLSLMRPTPNDIED